MDQLSGYESLFPKSIVFVPISSKPDLGGDDRLALEHLGEALRALKAVAHGECNFRLTLRNGTSAVASLDSQGRLLIAIELSDTQQRASTR